MALEVWVLLLVLGLVESLVSLLPVLQQVLPPELAVLLESA